MYDITPLCARLKARRVALSLPVSKLAKALGVSVPEMYVLEAGKRKSLSVARLSDWCAALGEPFSI